jgi:hypothetical protein
MWCDLNQCRCEVKSLWCLKAGCSYIYLGKEVRWIARELSPAHPWHMTRQQHVKYDDLYDPVHSDYSCMAFVSRVNSA